MLVELDPERLMRRIRRSLAAAGLERANELSTLVVLHQALLGKASVELGVCSVMGRVATSMEFRPYWHSGALLRQGRLCFGLHGIHSTEAMEEDLSECVEEDYRQAGALSGGLIVDWRWGKSNMCIDITREAQRLIRQCAEQEVSSTWRDAIDGCTLPASGECIATRL